MISDKKEIEEFFSLDNSYYWNFILDETNRDGKVKAVLPTEEISLSMIKLEDIQTIIDYDDGEPDDKSFVLIGQTYDKRYFYIDFFGVYTFELSRAGTVLISQDFQKLWQFGLDDEDRTRLKHAYVWFEKSQLEKNINSHHCLDNKKLKI
jgi:hypothetical protein